MAASAETYRQLSLFGDVFEKVRTDYVERPDEAKLIEAAEKPEGEITTEVKFNKGDKIKVNNGAFQNFEGEVDEVIADKGMVRIITTIFGRPTPLELEYWQIEKM